MILSSINYIVWLIISALFFAVGEFLSKKFALNSRSIYVVYYGLLECIRGADHLVKNPASEEVVKKIKLFQAKKHTPIVVVIDGGSGAGKTTLAAAIESELDAVLIPIDDFFSGHIPDDKWDNFTIEEKLDKVFDWQRLRSSVLVPLLNSKPAKWHSIDFEKGIQLDGTYKLKSDCTIRKPAKIILLEGAYSSGPKISDLVGISILVDVEIEKRHSRLAAREPKEFLDKWHQRWDDVEKYYFSEIRPKKSYDLVVKYN